MRTAFHSFLLRQKKAGERLREKRRQRGIEHAGLDFIRCFVGKIIVFCDADYGYLRMTRKYTLFFNHKRMDRIVSRCRIEIQIDFRM